jgi:hypothetical protein
LSEQQRASGSEWDGRVVHGIDGKRPQTLMALELANDVRRQRAELRRQLAEGTLSAAQLLLDPPPAVRGWSIGELLVSQRRWGRIRCQKFLAMNKIGESKNVRDLTERQRRLLAEQLEPSIPREASSPTNS